MEGTTLGRPEPFPTEGDLEERFVDPFRATSGRVFVTWSAQNIDRTVTFYRACKRSGRLVLDLYTVDVLERLSALRDSLPRLGWAGIAVVITASMARMYRSTRRVNHPEFVDRCAASGHALGAAALRSVRDSAVMRPSLFRDFSAKGTVPTRDDAWVFSMWSGYRDRPEYEFVRAAFAAAGARSEHIHTSGHASPGDLVAFAGRVAPRHVREPLQVLVPHEAVDRTRCFDSGTARPTRSSEMSPPYYGRKRCLLDGLRALGLTAATSSRREPSGTPRSTTSALTPAPVASCVAYTDRRERRRPTRPSPKLAQGGDPVAITGFASTSSQGF